MDLLLEKRLKSNIWKLYLHNALWSMMFFIPLIAIFWQSKWLSYMEILLLQSIFSIWILVLELPTGYFADKFGKKNSLIVWAIIILISIYTYSLATNFWWFALAELLGALSMAFVSWSDWALLYDSLKWLGKKDEYKKYLGNFNAISMIMPLVVYPIWWMLWKVDFLYTFYLSLIFMAFLVPLTISLYDFHKEKSHKTQVRIKDFYLLIKDLLKNNKKFFQILFFYSLLYIFIQIIFWFYQPYMNFIGLDIKYFGFVIWACWLIAAISSKYAYKLEKYFSIEYNLILFFFLLWLSFLFMSKIIFIFGFLFFAIHQFVRWVMNVVVYDYVNCVTNENYRASTISFVNMFKSVFYSITIPFAGYYTDLVGLQDSIFMLFVLSVSLWIIFLVVHHFKRKQFFFG